MSFRRFHQPLWVLVSLSSGACGAPDDEAASASSQAQIVAAAAAGSPALRSIEALERAFRAFPPEALCDAQWCWIDPSPGDLTYNVVGGTSPDDIWFGADASGILHWDGATLSIVPTGLTKVSTIEVIAANDVWVAGGGKAAHWNGRAFTAYPAPFGELFRAGASVYIGGYGPLHEWTGSEFAPRADIVDATGWAGSAPNDLWVAAGSRGLLHFDGTAWTKVEGLRGYRVNEVVSFGPNDVWAETLESGTAGYLFYHYDGTSWTLRHTGRSHVHSIVGSGPTDRWFVNDSTVTHYDGRDFTTRAVAEHVVDVSMIAGLPYAVGWPAAVLRLSADPALEHRLISRAQGKMRAVWASSPTDVWAAGRDGAAWNYDGRTITPVETGVKVALNDIGGTSTDDVWMVGDDGVVLRGSLAGGFRTVPSGVTKDLTSVFAVSLDEVWIGGAGVLLRSTPSGLAEVALPWLKNGVIVDIHGLARDDLWAVTGLSAIHFDGTTWSAPYALASGGGVARVWALSPNNVWAVARGCGHGSCSSAHWTGTAWSSGIMAPPAELWAIPMQYNTGAGRSLISWALGPKDVWSVTTGGAVLHAIGR